MNTSNDNNNNNDDINNNYSENNNNDNNEKRRKGKGRQRISMEKIENETNLQVTFSKRRAGIFKKASELNTLCGAESAVMVFSPANKPHSFGHPNVEAIANRFLNERNSEGNPHGNTIDHLLRNHELVVIEAQLEQENEHKKELEEVAKANPSFDPLNFEQLEHMKQNVASFQREFEGKLINNAGETSSRANYNHISQPHQGLGFPAPGGHGNGAVINAGGSSFTSSGYSYNNFGYPMPYPSTGPSESNFYYSNMGVHPTTVVPYGGTGRASGSRSGTTNNRSTNENEMGLINEDHDAASQDTPNHGARFGGNYDRAL